MVPTVRMRALPSGKGYYLLGSERRRCTPSAPRSSSARLPASRPSTSWSRSRSRAAVQTLTPVRGADDVGLPVAFGPAAAAAADGESVQVVDHGFGIVAEPHQRHAEHGSGPAAAAHAVHGDADAALEVRDHVGGRGDAPARARDRDRSGGSPLTRSCSRNAVTVHGDGSYGATSWVRHTTWPMPSDGEQRPVGATRDTPCPASATGVRLTQ